MLRHTECAYYFKEGFSDEDHDDVIHPFGGVITE